MVCISDELDGGIVMHTDLSYSVSWCAEMSTLIHNEAVGETELNKNHTCSSLAYRNVKDTGLKFLLSAGVNSK